MLAMSRAKRTSTILPKMRSINVSHLKSHPPPSQRRSRPLRSIHGLVVEEVLLPYLAVDAHHDVDNGVPVCERTSGGEAPGYWRSFGLDGVKW